MLRKVPIILAPLMLVGVLPYAAWRQLAGLRPLWEAHVTLLMMLAAAGILAIVLRVAYRSWAAAAYGVSLIAAVRIDGVAPFIILGIGAVFTLIERRFDGEKIMLGVFVFALTKLAILDRAVTLALHKPAMPALETPSAGVVQLTSRPSVVHILMDGYGAPDELARGYGHDSLPFIDALKARGFSVFTPALTPFNQTLLVMSSVMSEGLVAPMQAGEDGALFRADLARGFRDGAVLSTFRANGYHLGLSRSGFWFFDIPDARVLASAQPLVPNVATYAVAGSSPRLARVSIDRLKASLKPGLLDDMPRPFFYFEHLLAPHPPFTIDRTGAPHDYLGAYLADGSDITKNSPPLQHKYVEGYREKALFVESAVLKQLDALPKGPIVVILHGDHGPGGRLDQHSAVNSCLSERMQTFFAIYTNVPEVKSAFVPSDQPFYLVNIYRRLFAALSGQPVPDLPARQAFMSWNGLDRPMPVPREALSESCDG